MLHEDQKSLQKRDVEDVLYSCGVLIYVVGFAGLILIHCELAYSSADAADPPDARSPLMGYLLVQKTICKQS